MKAAEYGREMDFLQGLPKAGGKRNNKQNNRRRFFQ